MKEDSTSPKKWFNIKLKLLWEIRVHLLQELALPPCPFKQRGRLPFVRIRPNRTEISLNKWLLHGYYQRTTMAHGAIKIDDGMFKDASVVPRGGCILSVHQRVEQKEELAHATLCRKHCWHAIVHQEGWELGPGELHPDSHVVVMDFSCRRTSSRPVVWTSACS